MNAILLFTLLTIINVTLSTWRSLATIKSGKFVSAIANAVCYGFYPLIVMLTAKDMVTIAANMIITGIVNFICVWFIKLIEEKAKKDRLWKVEMAIPLMEQFSVKEKLLEENIPHGYFKLNNWIIFNCYCVKQEQTTICVELAKRYDGKISAYESQPLL